MHLLSFESDFYFVEGKALRRRVQEPLLSIMDGTSLSLRGAGATIVSVNKSQL